MAAKKKSSSRRYGPAAGKRVESAMRRRNEGTLERGKHGHGGTVTSRKQAIAIGLSEAREEGDKVPPPPSSSKRSASKRSASKRSASKRSASKRSSTKRASSARSSSPRSTSKRSSTGKRAAKKK